MDDDTPALVLDCGSSRTQVGFAGEDAPRSVFASCVGIPKYRPAMICSSQRSFYIGDDAKCHSRRGVLNLEYPIQNGVVKNWDLMEMLMAYSFYEELKLGDDIQNMNMLFSDTIMNPHSNCEKLLELSFENFGLRGISNVPAPVLAIYASGRGTALSIVLGDGVIQILPVAQGYTFLSCLRRVNFGGSNLTDHMINLLKESKGINFTNNRPLVEEIIKEVCYIPLDYEEEKRKVETSASLDVEYELPDGQVLNLSHERFECPEILFSPQIIHKQIDGIHDLVFDSLQSADIDIRKDFYGNFLISGGTSFIPGIEQRLTREMINLAPNSMKIKVVAPPERMYSCWIGGSILASLSTFAGSWTTREEYEESGPRVIHRRYCL